MSACWPFHTSDVCSHQLFVQSVSLQGAVLCWSSSKTLILFTIIVLFFKMARLILFASVIQVFKGHPVGHLVGYHAGHLAGHLAGRLAGHLQVTLQDILQVRIGSPHRSSGDIHFQGKSYEIHFKKSWFLNSCSIIIAGSIKNLLGCTMFLYFNNS